MPPVAGRRLAFRDHPQPSTSPDIGGFVMPYRSIAVPLVLCAGMIATWGCGSQQPANVNEAEKKKIDDDMEKTKTKQPKQSR
jgi:hypothetical protein